jgi:hypothetical protein
VWIFCAVGPTLASGEIFRGMEMVDEDDVASISAVIPANADP